MQRFPAGCLRHPVFLWLLFGALAARVAIAAPVALLDIGEEGADVIGLHITAQVLRDAVDELPPAASYAEPPVLVLRLRSDGGFLAEVPPLADLIAEELPEEGWRVVVWVERALSAAALSALVAGEIVLYHDGVIGAAVATENAGGAALALEGAELETALQVGARCAALGGHAPALARSMQDIVPLYLLPTGALSNEAGEGEAQVINPPGEVLTLSAVRASEIGLARGVASTRSELIEVLRLSEASEIDAGTAQSVIGDHVRTVARELAEYRGHLAEIETLVSLSKMEGLAQPVLDDIRARGEIRVALLRAMLEERPRLGIHAACDEACLLVHESVFEGLSAGP